MASLFTPSERKDTSARQKSSSSISNSNLESSGTSKKNYSTNGSLLSNETDICQEKKVHVSLFLSGKKLGVAYYDVDTTILYCMADIMESSDFQFTKKVLTDIRPTTVITSATSKDDFLHLLKQAAKNDTGKDNLHFSSLEILPSRDFNYEASKRRIINLNDLPGLNEGATDDERFIYFSSLLQFENSCMVSAIGALLKYLNQSRTGIQLEEIGTAVPVLLIRMFSLKDILALDNQSYAALQIFRKDAHPSVYKCGEGKEGLSLFGIMNQTKSAAGSNLLKTWFLQPSTDINLINERLDAVEYFSSPRSLEALTALHDALKSIKNVMGILSKMRSAGASVRDWQNLYKTLFNAICIGDICKGLPQNLAIIHKISTSFTKELLHMANLIKTIVDFDESASLNHFVVKEGIDQELDEKKRTYEGMPYLMTKVAHDELNKLDKSITKCTVTYLPQLGYLLNIPLTENMKQTGDYNVDSQLDFKFVAEDLVYYKSHGTTELDMTLGDIQCDIRDHELGIMHRLQDVILEHTVLLNQVVELSAQLDCILALSFAAKEFQLTRPKLTSGGENTLNITAGRHLLQELCVPQFIVNDTNISRDSGCIKILTGPNASGKSVYLKQVGLIVFLAHIGSFVPADSAEMSIKDGIYTRIHAIESVSMPLSAFMLDLNQMAYSINKATKNSLVIVDEFGKGTSSLDGLALLCAMINYWIENDVNAPAVLLSTHFHQMRQLIEASSQIKYQTMDVMCSDEDDMVFLYQLKEGFAEYSYACHTAKLAGIPAEILQRAEEITSCIRNEQPIGRLMSLDDSSLFERYESIVEDFLQVDFDNDDVVTFLETLINERM